MLTIPGSGDWNKIDTLTDASIHLQTIEWKISLRVQFCDCGNRQWILNGCIKTNRNANHLKIDVRE